MSELVAYFKRNDRLPEGRLLSVRVLEVNRRERHFGMGGSATLKASKDGEGVILRIPARMVYPGREHTRFKSDKLNQLFELPPGTAMDFQRLNGYVTHILMCLPDDPVKALDLIRRQTGR